ncbi:MAG TPA: TPM domain-containing protein, partial [Polyangiales bacterium]|nr:TPM domain-containing protein [Polyangiales bacterium]
MLAWFALTSSVLLLVAQTAAADAPSLRGPVDDRAGMLSEAAQSLLRDDLVALERKTGHQFALLTLESLETDLEQYA